MQDLDEVGSVTAVVASQATKGLAKCNHPIITTNSRSTTATWAKRSGRRRWPRPKWRTSQTVSTLCERYAFPKRHKTPANNHLSDWFCPGQQRYQNDSYLSCKSASMPFILSMAITKTHQAKTGREKDLIFGYGSGLQ